MMLRQALDNAPRGTAAELARVLQVSPVMVSQWASGPKRPEPKRCRAIVDFFGGAIALWHLRPDDWHLIWPELVGAQGAPDVPAEPAHAG
jgi:DNA-binding transcriptional regulator YdaS (Cro superfamily)